VKAREAVMAEIKEATIKIKETTGRNSFSMRIINQNLRVSSL
jgi:hypothetical protein